MLEGLVLLLAVAGAAALYAALKFKGERDLARQRLADGERNEARLRESFQALAGETLRTQSDQFLKLAEQKLAAREASAVGEIDKRRAAVDQLLTPIGETLKKTQDELRKIEKEREGAYVGLRQQVQTMSQQSEQLRAETSKLVQALSSPNVRGRYGEIQLQRVAELAGMQAYCDFDTQATLSDGGRMQRPDMIVRLPNERVIVVDAKTNIGAYLEALDSKSPELSERALQRFADHVGEQAQALGKKGYWKHFDGSPELVVMFVPGDQFIDAALQRRPDLLELAARANVVIASPSTLIGLLRAVSVGWRERKLADNANELLALGSELHTRFGKALEYADGLGRAIERTANEYNQFIGSVEARVMPTLRKFEDAGARRGEPIRELKPVDAQARKLTPGTTPPPRAANDA